MKYLCTIIFTITLVLLQLVGAGSNSTEIPRGGVQLASYRGPPRMAAPLLPADLEPDEAPDTEVSEKPHGLEYNTDENTWTLYATVLQLKNTSVYGRPGEIAQIEYSLDGQNFRNGWIVLSIDNYSFVDETSRTTVIETGQSLQLYISGTYVARSGVDWEKCPRDDSYCMYASFVEGGFPKSEDYVGLTLCPSNTLIHSGFSSVDWINGMLAWRVRSLIESKLYNYAQS